MRCKDVKKLLNSKPEELTADERKRVKTHLETCTSCQNEQKTFERQLDVIDTIKQAPSLDQPELLTNDIMRAVRNAERFSKNPNPFDRLLDVISFRPVRLAFSACLLLILGLFFTQEMMVLNRLHHLEQRLSRHSNVPAETQFTALPKNVLSLLGKKEEQVVIDKELLEEFLQSYGELQMKNRLLLKALEEQAEQSNITWQDGLTEGELKSLLESESIQRKLKEL